MRKIAEHLQNRAKLIIFLNLILLVLLIIIIRNYSETIPLKTIKSNDLKISLYIVPDFKTKLHTIRIIFKNKSKKNKSEQKGGGLDEPYKIFGGKFTKSHNNESDELDNMYEHNSSINSSDEIIGKLDSDDEKPIDLNNL